MTTARAGALDRRGTFPQRVRARLLGVLSRLVIALPERPLDAVADLAGSLWYRLSPARAGLARANVQRVVRYLAAAGLGGPIVARAAVDGAVLDRVVRDAFREGARYYVDMIRLPGRTVEDVARRLVVETPEVVDTAFAPGASVVFVAMHFGAVEFPALFAVARGVKVTAPMETLADPELQAWVRRTRGSVGVEIVGLREARRALTAALEEGRSVGLVADRNVAGGTIEVPFFGSPAPLPMGPALLAVETGRPLYLAAVRRTGGGRYGGRLLPIEVPSEGTRRDRVTATMRNVAAAMEESIALAPAQWWTVLLPIWPDIDSRAATGTGRLETRGDA